MSGILLDAWRVIGNGGEQRLALIHIGGETQFVDPPFLPYFYMRGKEEDVREWCRHHLPQVTAIIEERCVGLSDLAHGPETWCKVKVRNVNVITELNKLYEYEPTAREAHERETPEAQERIRKFRESIQEEDQEDGKTAADTARFMRLHEKPVVAENHLGFVERVLADEPEWLNKHARAGPNDITFCWLDIEQSAQPNRFPEETDPLISIAYEFTGPGAARLEARGIPREDVLIITEEEIASMNMSAPGVGDIRLWDTRILKEFARIAGIANVDIWAGYNLHGYDLPMLAKRSKRVGVGAKWMCRRGEPKFEKDKVGMWEKDRTVLSGCLVFDVFERVFIDQSLNGKVKTRGLKDVAKYRKMHVEEIDTSNALAEFRADPKKFVSYNMNDVKLAKNLGVPYWANVLAYAELTDAPLRHVVDASANFFGTRFAAEDFAKSPAAFLGGARVLSDGSNHKRFSHLSNHPSCPRSAKGEPVIVTGAKVAISQTGLFVPVCALHAEFDESCDHCLYGTFKVDVGGMYPSIAETLGLGPDNTVWVGFEQPEDWPIFLATYVEGTPSKGTVDAWREYRIPDPEWGGRHIIRVYGNGKLAQRVTAFKKQRSVVKKQMKGLDEESMEYKLLDGQQQTLKQWNNSVPYGNQANDYSRYGSFVVAMMITGIGRIIGSFIEQALGDASIETDTDGVYSRKLVSDVAINKAIDEFVRDRCLLEKNTIKVDLDRYWKSFFHSMKNYVLLNRDGTMVKHGSAIIGAKHCGLWDDAVERAAREVFALEPAGSYDAWRKQTEDDLRAARVPIAKLVQRSAVKPQKEYATNTMGKQIAASHVAVFGREPHPDSKVSYVVTRNGFEVSAASDVARRIDVKNYAELLTNVRDLFKLGKRAKQMTLKDLM